MSIPSSQQTRTSSPSVLTALDAARAYLRLGFSVVPILGDGTKKPAVSWQEWQTKKPTENHLLKWFAPANGPRGVAIVHGAISGDLDKHGQASRGSEVLDFDVLGAYEEFAAACEMGGFSETLARCVHVRTPSGGRHVYYRYDYNDVFAERSERDGNQKLAMVAQSVNHLVPEARDGAVKTVLSRASGGGGRLNGGASEDFENAVRAEITRVFGWRYNVGLDEWVAIRTKSETRGEGGYTIAPGSPAECHPTGNVYKLVAGSATFPRIPLLSKDERDALLAIARSLNEYVKPENYKRPTLDEGTKRRDARPGELKPGDDFNARGNPLELLLSEGWQVAGERGEIIDLARPGKSARQGWSGTLNAVAPGVFYCFTSNGEPFENDHGYKPFSVYALLKCGGDYAEAARQLAAQGFGDKREPAKRAEKFAPVVEKAGQMPTDIGFGSALVAAGFTGELTPYTPKPWRGDAVEAQAALDRQKPGANHGREYTPEEVEAINNGTYGNKTHTLKNGRTFRVVEGGE